jgi:4-hydroxy-tetrahydrodipicolinate reductase
MKRLALVGYGKMGRLLQNLAPEAGFEAALILDEAENRDGVGLTAGNFEHIDAAIEFTLPEAAPANLVRLAELKVPVVCGTTGWFARLPEIRAVVERNGSTLVWSPNFSIGVNIFTRVVAEAAKWMKAQPEYEAWAWEIHHSAKKDAPSGTLLKLVDEMRKSGYAARVDQSSSRAGRVPGTHEIGFDSAADTITLRHTARSREGFARGALKAAQWASGRTPGCFEFSEIFFQQTKE